MKTQNRFWYAALLVGAACAGAPALAQEVKEDVLQAEDSNKPERPAFESSYIIDNLTGVVPSKGTLEFMIQHRFGDMSNGIKDLYGIYASGSNIRLGMGYTVFDNLGVGSIKGPLAIGIGSTKNSMIQDVNVKYGMLQQTKSGRVPVSVTYYGVAAAETAQTTEDLPNGNGSDRLSYFHQLIIARRINSKLSVMVAPSISHYNVVPATMDNDQVSVAVAARYKISPQSSLMVNYDQPITKHSANNPYYNFSFGIEIATSSHAFQVFASAYEGIVPQKNNMFNQTEPFPMKYMRIGFNITRLWNLK